jgi:hypothetical protein
MSRVRDHKCTTCHEWMTARQSRGHAAMWGHYEFVVENGGLINLSRYTGLSHPPKSPRAA